jgi:hypothetical protein
MRYTLHIYKENEDGITIKTYFRTAGFICEFHMITPDYQPRYFDTIEAARSVGTLTVEKGTYNFVYLCDINGAQIERIERK